MKIITNLDHTYFFSPVLENPSIPTPDAKTPKSNKPVKPDKNQPTIEKLFVTPVRKRKRTMETSPIVTPKSESEFT